MFSPQDTANILVEALPYFQEFSGKTIVVKYGGNAMISDDLKEKVMQDITLMKQVGIRPVIVHGGGPDITGFLKKVGKDSEFVSGLRVTDEETMEIVGMVLNGKVNAEIVLNADPPTAFLTCPAGNSPINFFCAPASSIPIPPFSPETCRERKASST